MSIVNKKNFETWISKYNAANSKNSSSDEHVKKLEKNARADIEKGNTDSLLFPVWEYVMKSADGKYTTSGVVRASSKKVAQTKITEIEKKRGNTGLKFESLDISDSSRGQLQKDLLFMESLSDQEALDEVLDVSARRRRAQVMRRYASKIALARKRKMRRMASKEQLTTRARRAAIGVIRTRFAGSQGKNYAELSPSQKVAVDTKIASRKGMIGRIAQKLFPKIKQKEMARLAGRAKAA